MPTRLSSRICSSRFGEGNRNDGFIGGNAKSEKPVRATLLWMVGVSTAGLGLGLGYAPIIVYSFGIFLKPLIREFH